MSPVGDVVFLGVDLGWYGKPSGLASIGTSRESLHLRSMTRLENPDEILRWIQTEAGDGSAVVAVDAPLVICNRTGIREAERAMNQEFRRFHAGCHAANLGRPCARKVLSFSQRLADLGFGHGDEMNTRERGRFKSRYIPTLRRSIFSVYPEL
jgi:predicted RNase H-like nuclease